MRKFTSAFFCFAISIFIIESQNSVKVSTGFDEQKAYQEAAKKGIPESDRKGYIEGYLKREYLHQHPEENNKQSSPILPLEVRKNLPKYYTDQSNKTTYVNLTPQPMSAYCPNAGFENLDFSGWTPSGTNLSGTISSGPVASWTGGLNQGANNTIPPGLLGTNQVALMTIPAGNNNPALGPLVGYDGIAINPTTGLAEIPVVSPTGSGVSVRLGNDATNYGTERLIYTLTVSPQNAQFTYQYAVVLQDPLHPNGIQPFFKVQFQDAAGLPLTGCGQYQVDASQASTDPTFVGITYNFESLYYKTWTTVGVDLSAWMGQTLTVEFWTADCGYGGHFGYAYIDATCAIIQGTVNGFCTGSPQVALVAPSGFVDYEWNGPNNLIPIPGANDDTLIVNNPMLNDTFYVQMVNAAGCTTFLQTVILPSTLQLQSISSTPSCPTTTDGSATAVATGGLIAGYDYIWTSEPWDTVLNAPAGIVYDTAQTVFNLPQDTVYLHVVSGNCPPKDTFVVIGPTAGLTAVPSATLSCFGGSTGSLNLTSVAGGSGPFVYSITGPVSQSANSPLTSYTFPSIPSGTYTISVAPQSGSCGYDTVITVNSQPVTITPATNDICPNDTLAITSMVSGASHQWYNPNGTPIAGATSATFTATPAQYGVYTDTITDALGCKSVFTMSLTPTAFSSSVTNVTDNPCYMDSVGAITVSANGGNITPYVFIWNGPNNFTGTGSSQSNLFSGTYQIIANSGNCKDTLTANIVEPPMPNDTLEITTTFCDGDTSAVLMAPDSFSNYQWYYNGIPIPGANDTSLFILNPGATYANYSVTYIIPPCQRKTIVVFRSIPGPLFTPDVTTNIFTPNKDGKNDLFHPYYNVIIDAITLGNLHKYIDYAEEEYNIKIFDRWGLLVFESNDYAKQWDGNNSNNKACEDGTYFWMTSFKSRCGNGQVTSHRGYVQLLR